MPFSWCSRRKGTIFLVFYLPFLVVTKWNAFDEMGRRSRMRRKRLLWNRQRGGRQKIPLEKLTIFLRCLLNGSWLHWRLFNLEESLSPCYTSSILPPLHPPCQISQPPLFPSLLCHVPLKELFPKSSLVLACYVLTDRLIPTNFTVLWCYHVLIPYLCHLPGFLVVVF